MGEEGAVEGGGVEGWEGREGEGDEEGFDDGAAGLLPTLS